LPLCFLSVLLLSEPLLCTQLPVSCRTFEHDDAQAEVVVGVVEGRDLLISRALEIARDGIALPERLPVGDRVARDRGNEPTAGNDESEEERRYAAEFHPRAL